MRPTGRRGCSTPPEDFYTNDVEATRIAGWQNFVRGDLPLREEERDHPASETWIAPAGALTEKTLNMCPDIEYLQ